jgi:hypothetical protein
MSIIIYLFVRLKDRPANTAWILVGGLTALVYYAKSLWLPGLLPVVFYVLIKKRKLADHACVEDDFARDLGEGAEPLAGPDAAVFEDQDCLQTDSRSFRVRLIISISSSRDNP